MKLGGTKMSYEKDREWILNMFEEMYGALLSVKLLLKPFNVNEDHMKTFQEELDNIEELMIEDD